MEEMVVKKWRCTGYIARQDSKRWTLRILQWTPRDTKRTRSRPQRRWVDIKEIAGENQTEIDECGTVWRRLSFRSG